MDGLVDMNDQSKIELYGIMAGIIHPAGIMREGHLLLWLMTTDFSTFVRVRFLR